MRREGLGHPDRGLLACGAHREDALDVGTMRAPRAVLGLFVDDEVILHRRSLSPVARRIAASVPEGTVLPRHGTNVAAAADVRGLPMTRAGVSARVQRRVRRWMAMSPVWVVWRVKVARAAARKSRA